MLQALAEGRKALPACLPNPPVGCVVVRSGAISGRGHTQPPGGPHAEIGALAASQGDLTDATLYVSLEPCSFHGRTPACVEAIIARGIRKVVVAIVDPDPRNNGAGIEKLRAAGIDVQVGIMEEQARTDLGPYLNLPSNKWAPSGAGSRGE
ncbi:MAG TPA: bifunctional diaminohydroxyphosphoribosylaminopyrimidine deaminase/5-amino-6-(5-phosphoribosylamino)uracil reductase RibD [Steroidobacteraceae bacterium]